MLRQAFEQIYAKRHKIDDLSSLEFLRNETGYDDQHLDDCWFFFKSALAM